MPKLYHGRVVLIHGAEFNRKNRGNMRRLAPSFRAAGFCTIIPTYGFLPALLLGLFPWLDRRIAESLSGFINPDDILIGHSNGATLAYLINQRVPVRGSVLINAALEADRIPLSGFVHIYYNAGDIVTKFAEFFPFHVWGNMGTVGYAGVDSRVKNIDQGNPPEVGLPALDGHSDVFAVGKCRKWARYMAELCLREVLATKADHG